LIFELAGTKPYAQRFRDTFSVNLLEAGGPLETVTVIGALKYTCHRKTLFEKAWS
jgi:hypothetical protein